METYRGHVRTPADAIKLFEACRLGLLPRVQRRLSEKERQSITSGSVFVWDEREAGMRRWTDGKSWSASRVSGSFLTYREMEGKRGGGNYISAPTRRMAGKTPDSGRGSDEDQDMDGDGPDGYRYKPDGLMKQSFSITTQNGQHLHLISYYARPHGNSPELLQPTNDPALRHIIPAKGMYPETVHDQAQGPAVTRTPMQGAYVNSPQQMAPGPAQAHRPPYGYQPNYSWPPSPAATPPYGYPPNPYSQLPPPPNATLQSPHYSQHPLPPTSNTQSAFDRAPPPLSDSSLPPPSSGRSSLSGSQPMAAPTYKPNPSPRIDHARIAAEQAQQAQRLQQQQQQQQQSMQAPPIDPRIMGPSPAAPVHQNGTSYSREPTPSSQQQSGTNGQTIPSIQSLVHASNGEQPPELKSNASTTSRNGSASPKDKQGSAANGQGSESGERGGPQDIPHARMPGFGGGGEDMRALRVLDRKFMLNT